MTVQKIYQRFKLPPNLQEHLLRVTKVALFITDHWVGPKIDHDLIKKSALLHDLGNIVKFDLKKYPKFLGKEKGRVNFWLKVQEDITDQYGTDDHQATLKMLEELGVNSRMSLLVKSKTFSNALKMAESSNWEAKILFYADLRVGPFGILSLKERLNEALPRLDIYRKLDTLDELIAACYRIENQIQANVNTGLTKISGESIERDEVELLKTKV